MNELLQLIHQFNTTHKAAVFLNYSGHVNVIDIRVNHPDCVYEEGGFREVIWDGSCYTNKEINNIKGVYPTVEALTEAFVEFMEGYHE